MSWFEGTMPHIHRLPKLLRKAFINDILNRYLAIKPDAVLENGVICFFWGHYELCGEK